MCSIQSKKLCEEKNCEICFNKSFSSHEKSNFWSNKNELQPKQVFKCTKNKYIFDCECGHQFEISLRNIVTRNQWCSYCSNPPQKLCDDCNCKNCFEKSFASNQKSKFWSNKNKLQPRQLLKASSKKCIFDCECGHQIEIPLHYVNNNNWCSYCSNPPQKLCDDDNCRKCLENSFASHEKAKYWSKTNKEKPRQVFKYSDKKYNFDCEVCNHMVVLSLGAIGDDEWCSYCSNNKLCDNNECKMCFEKSFASNEKAIYWSDQNITKPRQIYKNSRSKYIFDCHICNHNFESVLRDK